MVVPVITTPRTAVVKFNSDYLVCLAVDSVDDPQHIVI
jgi:hypothetical protein